jgi:hypothetical protein
MFLAPESDVGDGYLKLKYNSKDNNFMLLP